MKIEDRYDEFFGQTWKRKINNKNFLFRHVVYQNGITVIDVSVWKPVVEGGQTGAWHRRHHLVFR